MFSIRGKAKKAYESDDSDNSEVEDDYEEENSDADDADDSDIDDSDADDADDNSDDSDSDSDSEKVIMTNKQRQELARAQVQAKIFGPGSAFGTAQVQGASPSVGQNAITNLSPALASFLTAGQPQQQYQPQPLASAAVVVGQVSSQPSSFITAGQVSSQGISPYLSTVSQSQPATSIQPQSFQPSPYLSPIAQPQTSQTQTQPPRVIVKASPIRAGHSIIAQPVSSTGSAAQISPTAILPTQVVGSTQTQPMQPQPAQVQSPYLSAAVQPQIQTQPAQVQSPYLSAAVQPQIQTQPTQVQSPYLSAAVQPQIQTQPAQVQSPYLSAAVQPQIQAQSQIQPQLSPAQILAQKQTYESEEDYQKRRKIVEIISNELYTDIKFSPEFKEQLVLYVINTAKTGASYGANIDAHVKAVAEYIKTKYSGLL